jgi:hypothetical protein
MINPALSSDMEKIEHPYPSSEFWTKTLKNLKKDWGYPYPSGATA